MNKAMIPVVLAGILASTTAFAHRGWDDGEGYRPYRPQQVVAYPATAIVYQAPPVAYAPPPPPVIYRERVVYREVPVYRQQSEPAYYAPQPAYAPAYQHRNPAAPVIGAVAGGVIGNQIGHGAGRAASTAVGAVLGAIVGERLSY